jgi:Bacterial PH domain
MLNRMGTETSTTRHVFRQRSSVRLAVVCGVVGLFLLLSLARNWADYPRPLFAVWVLLGLAVAWSVFVRPAVLLEVGGVTLRNVVRDVHIPWTRLTDVECRWNLKVLVGDRGYTAWAMSSEPERPKRVSGGMFRMPVPGRLDRVASAYPKPSATVLKVTAQSVARSIREAKQEYDEAVVQGRLPASPADKVQVTWVPLAMALLLLPAIAVVALSLI